jgi:hypothetical protein
MSTDESQPGANGQPDHEGRLPLRRGPNPAPDPGPAPAKRRGLLGHTARVMAWIVGSVLAIVVLLIAGFAWYSRTADFQRRDRRTRRSGYGPLRSVASGG